MFPETFEGIAIDRLDYSEESAWHLSVALS